MYVHFWGKVIAVINGDDDVHVSFLLVNAVDIGEHFLYGVGLRQNAMITNK